MRRKGDLVLGIFLLLLGISRTQAGWIDGNIYFFALGIIAIVVGTIIIAKAIHSQKVAAEQERQAAAQKAASPQQTAPMSTESQKSVLPHSTAPQTLANPPQQLKHINYSDVRGNFRKTYYYENVRIFSPDEIDLHQFNLGNVLTLKQEPTNPYDDRAVMLLYNRQKLGYLYRNKLQEMANDYLERDDSMVMARIYDISLEHHTVWIDICFYRIAPREKRPGTKEYRLTGNRNAEMQEALCFLDITDPVTYSWDFEKEKYIAFSRSGDIGYFPASAEPFLEKKAPVEIAEITEDDEGRYGVIVSVQTE